MKTSSWIGIALAGVIGMIILTGITKFNSLSKLDEKADQYHSLVDTKLQKRSDLLENAASTAKGYGTHEQKTFIEVAQARAGAAKIKPIDPKTGQPATDEALAANDELRKKFAENQAAAAVATQQAALAINQIREAYPQLKADGLFTKVMTEISTNEREIAAARAMSNDYVRKFNTAIRTFPGNIVAKLGDFEKKKYFEVEDSAKKAPKLKY